MSSCLMIVDLQTGFRTDDTIRSFLSLPNLTMYDYVIATRFINTEGSLFKKVLDYDGCTEAQDLCMANIIPRDIKIFDKHSYSSLTSEVLEFIDDNDIDNVTLVGADTDACILATAFACFDRGILVDVLDEYCSSSGGDEYHNAAMFVLRRNILYQYRNK